MRCPDPNCTGSHDLRKRANMCPRTRANERATSERFRRENPAKYMLIQGRYDTYRRRQRAAVESDRA